MDALVSQCPLKGCKLLLDAKLGILIEIRELLLQELTLILHPFKNYVQARSTVGFNRVKNDVQDMDAVTSIDPLGQLPIWREQRRTTDFYLFGLPISEVRRRDHDNRLKIANAAENIYSPARQPVQTSEAVRMSDLGQAGSTATSRARWENLWLIATC